MNLVKIMLQYGNFNKEMKLISKKKFIECDVDILDEDWNNIKFKTSNDFDEFIGYELRC